MDSLRLTQFRPSGFKVKCIEFHPMQPWLAIADKGNKISVWDFESEQVLPPLLCHPPSPRSAPQLPRALPRPTAQQLECSPTTRVFPP